MELYVGWGTGYTLPEKQDRYKGIIGVIPTGSQYTPVKKVNYTVESTRVGMRTDYERLVLDIWSNGAVRPNDALSQSAHILDKYFRMFFDLGAAGFSDDSLEADEMSPEIVNIPDLRIEELDFSQRTFNCLRRAGLLTLARLGAGNRKRPHQHPRLRQEISARSARQAGRARTGAQAAEGWLPSHWMPSMTMTTTTSKDFRLLDCRLLD